MLFVKAEDSPIIGSHFYHGQIKQAVSVFGSLFNNITIQRRDGKEVPVPISYGPRSKWLEAHDNLTMADEAFENLLPRLSFELVAMSYDSNRKLTNKQTVLRNPDERGARQRTFVPTPYNLDFTLYLQTKTLNDGWQIIEQILPFFTPAYTVRVRHFPDDDDATTPLPQNAYDMPFTLTALTWADDWQGDISEKRIIEWTLEFTTKIHLHGPVAQIEAIYDARANVQVNDMNGIGTQVGYVQLDSDMADSEVQRYLDDSETLNFQFAVYEDSDGVITKVCKPIDDL